MNNQKNRKKKILIIEDEDSIQQIYGNKLQSEGFEVIPAYVGQKGLQLARSEHPDLIILDIILPQGMNGFDVLENLKADPTMKAIPVLILTNLESEKDVAMGIGAAEYIVKANTSVDDMVHKVKQLLG